MNDKIQHSTEDVHSKDVRKPLFEMRFSNSLFDLIYFNIIRTLSGLSLVVVFVIIALSSYFQIYKKIGMDDPFALAIYLTRYICIFFAILICYNIVWTIYLNISGKLKGIIGEHYLTFFDDEFVEKTQYNESSVKYRSIQLLRTIGYFIIKTNTSGQYVVPVRMLSDESKEAFIKYLSGGKIRNLTAPFAALAVALFSFIFYQTGMRNVRYSVFVTSTPFSVIESNGKLFVSTGRHIFRSSNSYGEWLGLKQNNDDKIPSRNMDDVKFENKLFVVSGNDVSEAQIPSNASIGRIITHEGGVYFFLMPSAEVENEPKIAKWVDGEIIEYNEINYRDFIRKIHKRNVEDEESEVEETKSGALHEYEFDQRSAGKEFVEMKSGENVYKVFFKRIDDWEKSMKGRYLLSAEPSDGTKHVFADFVTGQFAVTKREYDEFKVSN